MSAAQPPTDPSSDRAPTLRAVRRLHDELSRTATGGRVDPRGAGPHAPPAASGTHPLPPAADLPAGPGLGALLARRRSSYSFGAGQPTALDLATLLRWALGPQREIPLPDGGTHTASTAPSAGGLASVDPWLVVRGEGELPRGVHRVELREAPARLETVRAGDPTAWLERALDQPELARRATVLVVLAARLDVAMTRYPARHYRTVHVDAGVALQNLYLTSAALGLPCCAVMGFDDDATSALLGLDDLPGVFPAVAFALGSAVER